MHFRSPDEEQIRFAAKAALRERLRRVRQILPREAAQARDARIHKRCLELIDAGPVASYLPMRGEISTTKLHEELRCRGYTIVLPAIEPGDEENLVWRRFDVDTPLIRHAFGFEMPAQEADKVSPGLVRWTLVPCLAADPRGYRLGWGGGFYDRALPLLRQAQHIAVAYDFQLMAELPVTHGDRSVDWVVTDTRLLRAGVDGP